LKSSYFDIGSMVAKDLVLAMVIVNSFKTGLKTYLFSRAYFAVN